MGFPTGSGVNSPPANAGNSGSVVGLGRSLGEESGNPLQYSCLGNPIDRGAWWTTIHGVVKELDVTIIKQQQLYIIHCMLCSVAVLIFITNVYWAFIVCWDLKVIRLKPLQDLGFYGFFSLITLNLVRFVLFTIHPMIESQVQERTCIASPSPTPLPAPPPHPPNALILSELHTHRMIFSFWASTCIWRKLMTFRHSLLYFQSSKY